MDLRCPTSIQIGCLRQKLHFEGCNGVAFLISAELAEFFNTLLGRVDWSSASACGVTTSGKSRLLMMLTQPYGLQRVAQLQSTRPSDVVAGDCLAFSVASAFATPSLTFASTSACVMLAFSVASAFATPSFTFASISACVMPAGDMLLGREHPATISITPSRQVIRIG